MGLKHDELGTITRNTLISAALASGLLALMGLFRWYKFTPQFEISGTDSHVSFGYGMSDGLAVCLLGLFCLVASVWQFRRDKLSPIRLGLMAVAGSGAIALTYRAATFAGDICAGSSPSLGGITCMQSDGGDTGSLWMGGSVLPPVWIALATAAFVATLAVALPFVENYFYEDESEPTNEPKTVDGALQW
ncbi:MAG: hypothetical protein ABI559_08615 [Chloroflexota bacterium]